MRQERLNTIRGTIIRAELAIGGATKHGETIGLKHNTAGVMILEKNALMVASDTYNMAREEQSRRQSVLDNTTTTVSEFVTLVRDLQKPRLGRQHSAAWDVV